MVEDRVTDGHRIAQLLASELTAREDGPLAGLKLTDVDRNAEPTADGTFVYRIANRGETVADAYLQPERVRLEFRFAPDTVAGAAQETGLRVRPKAVEPPQTLVFVESGVDAKRALDVVRVALRRGSDF